jgi:hypothetical protein
MNLSTLLPGTMSVSKRSVSKTLCLEDTARSLSKTLPA